MAASSSTTPAGLRGRVHDARGGSHRDHPGARRSANPVARATAVVSASRVTVVDSDGESPVTVGVAPAREARRLAAEVLDRPGRRERADEIEEVAARGFRSDEIAEKLALARSTVNKYRRDPDGDQERARRERYRGRCRGRPTRGSDGPGRAPEWCPECAPLRRRSWNDAQTLEAILQAHHPQRVRRAAGGPKVGLYVRFEPAGGRQRRRRANG